MADKAKIIKLNGNRGRILQLLEEHPDGIHARDVASLLGLEYVRAASCCSDLKSMGLIGSLPDPLGRSSAGGSNRQRWFLPEHEARVKKVVAKIQKASAIEAKPKGRAQHTTEWSRAGLGRIDVQLRGAKGGAQPKLTVAVTPRGRYEVTSVEPFFGGMRPGQYLSTGSAIERAYGASTGLETA